MTRGAPRVELEACSSTSHLQKGTCYKPLMCLYDVHVCIYMLLKVDNGCDLGKEVYQAAMTLKSWFHIFEVQ